MDNNDFAEIANGCLNSLLTSNNRVCIRSTSEVKRIPIETRIREAKERIERKRFERKIRSIRNKEKSALKARNTHLLNKYGISLKQYDYLFLKSNGKCEICSKQFPRLSVDHSHISGAVRGLLCSKCNSILGFCSDNIEILNKAIEYLRKVM